MKKNKIWLITLSIIAILVCIGIGAIVFIIQKNRPIPFEVSYSMEQYSFIEVGKQTNGSLCLIAPAEEHTYPRMIFGEYILLKSWKGQRRLSADKDETIKEYEEMVFDFYNFKTGEIEKSIDLAAIAREYTPGKQFNTISLEAKIIDGRRYLVCLIEAIEEPDNYDLWEYIVYDFDEDRVTDIVAFDNVKDNKVVRKQEFTEEEKAYYKSFYIIMDDWSCNFLEINHLIPESSKNPIESGSVNIDYVRTWRDGIIEVKMLATQLPKENARLYEEFPELKGYKAKKGDIVTLYLGGYLDAEEILGMLLEEGTPITYKGCVLEETGSIDGKEHEISSMEDYIKWCSWRKVSRYLE